MTWISNYFEIQDTWTIHVAAIYYIPAFAKVQDHAQYGCVFPLIAFSLFSHRIIVSMFWQWFITSKRFYEPIMIAVCAVWPLTCTAAQKKKVKKKNIEERKEKEKEHFS